ncbi:MAG: hypothetical protein RLO52_44510 [Sandaracinaceae bacterium]
MRMPPLLTVGVTLVAVMACSESHGSLGDAGPTCAPDAGFGVARALFPEVEPETPMTGLSESEARAFCDWKRALAGEDEPVCPNGRLTAEAAEGCYEYLRSIAGAPICSPPFGLVVECDLPRLRWCTAGGPREDVDCPCEAVARHCRP